MIDENIRMLNQKIGRIRIAQQKLQKVVGVAETTLALIKSTEKITETQILAGESIDRGKIEEMRVTCDTIKLDAEKTIESCQHAISTLTEQVNYLIELRNSAGGGAW